MSNNKMKTHLGEIRQDIITGNWVVIATERAKRPDHLATPQENPDSIPKYKEDCPFCNLIKYPQEPHVLRLPDNNHSWKVHIFPNKYPAFKPSDEFKTWGEGPYRVLDAVGYHEILATRHHNQFDGLCTVNTLSLEIEALLLRYRQLRVKPSVNYIQIIKNHGEQAGGSLEHPHNQIITTPVLPNDVSDMLHGVERYKQASGKDPFEISLEFERSEGKRIVWENEHFTVYCPFASRVPFETWIMPKQAQPFFETIDHNKRESLAEAMQQILGKLYKGLNNPPYNYYLYSAPCDTNGFVCKTELFSSFRWHIQILPRLSKIGGFELSTGIEINTASPEESASFLREQSLPSTVR